MDDTLRPLATLPPDQLGAGWRPGFLKGIDRWLSLRRSDRPQSAMELRQAIGLTAPAGGAPALSEIAAEFAAATVRPVTFSIKPDGEQRAASPPPRSRLGMLLGLGSAALVVSVVALAVLGPPKLGSAGGGSLVVEPSPQTPSPNAANDAAERRVREAEEARRRAEMAAADERARAKKLAAALEKEVSDRQAAEKRDQQTGTQRLSALLDRAPDPTAAGRFDPAQGVRPGSGQSFRDCPTCPEMVVVPGGRFRMGSPDGETGRDRDEGPAREVEIRQSFAVGKFEVTFADWQICVDNGGCASNSTPADQGWGRERQPVINVSWADAKEYVTWLARASGKPYRLLTEAEWEYAARAGSSTRWSSGDDEWRLREHTWSAWNRSTRTQIVGQKAANAWGLHDAHGNVWEWVEDCWIDSYRNAPGDERARTTACTDTGRRVVRGGSWGNGPRHLRSAERDWLTTVGRNYYLGFRLARTLNP